MSVQAVILAGGAGKRIHPLGLNKPKSMFEIMGKPLIQYVVENLKSVGITDIVIVKGPQQEQIEAHFGDGSAFGVNIQYALQERPLGQANAVQAAESKIKPGHFFVVNANDIFDPQLFQDVINKAQAEKADLALVGRKVDEPWRFGVMRFNAEGQLVGVIEKPSAGTEPSNIAVIGLYYFSTKIFQCIKETPQGETDDQFERAYQRLIDDRKGTYVSYDGIFESYKYPWNLLTISDLLLEQIEGQTISPSAKISERAIIGDKVIIADNVRVFENAVVRGPAYIGPGAVIGNNSMVWGGCSFGAGCVVGFGSEIKHVVFGHNVWTHRNYVGDSIVSDNCSFGAGTITANLRFDEGPIPVNIGDGKLSTGMGKFGVIMAEGCRTGSNSVLLPGIKVGPNSIVGPGVTLGEDLGPNKIALSTKETYEIRDNKLDLSKISRAEQMKKINK